jgi:hypothetical protein
MRVAEKIEKRILKMTPGNTFKYQELGIAPDEYSAATKAIERLIKRDIIKRASTGLFYIPKQTSFGNIKPREEELLKPYLFNDGQRTAYITGIALYNRMGITTQVPKNIRLASRDRRINTKIGSVEVKSVKSYVEVTNENYSLLEMLDVIKDFKIIPDTDKTKTIRFLLNTLAGLTVKEKEKIIRIALKYPPRVRALAGALFSQLNPADLLQELKTSINPLTIYKYEITSQQLSTIENWNIQ